MNTQNALYNSTVYMGNVWDSIEYPCANCGGDSCRYGFDASTREYICEDCSKDLDNQELKEIGAAC